MAVLIAGLHSHKRGVEMKGEEIIGMLKSYINKTLVGMGALKGANCTIKSLTKSGGLTTVVFSWVDTDGTEKTSTMLVYDGTNGTNGTDGIDGFSPTIIVKESTDSKYILTITDANGSYDTPNLKGSGGGGGSSELADLTDVQLASLAGGQALVYDSTAQKWVNLDFKLSALKDITLTSLAGDQILIYDSTAQKFKNVDAGAVSETEYNAISALLS